MTSRIYRAATSLVAYGPRATMLAIGAKRRGAKQKLREFAGFVQYLHQTERPMCVLEIGTLHGGTLWAWCQIATLDALVISIDLPGGAFGGGYPEEDASRLQAYARGGQNLRLIRADSHAAGTLNQVIAVLDDRPVDLLFVDGDHTYEGVRCDFELYAPLVRPGGLFVVHDILRHDEDPDCQVDAFWEEVSAGRTCREFVDAAERGPRGQWGGIGVIVMSALVESSRVGK
jgi:predicted O-methyltransferase YrrM